MFILIKYRIKLMYH